MASESLSREQRRNARKVLGSEAAAFFERVEIDNRQLSERIKRLGNQLHAEAEERKRTGAARDAELERLRREVAVLSADVVVPLGKRVLALERELASVGGTACLARADVNELARYGATLTLIERVAWLVTGQLPRQRADAGARLLKDLHADLRTGSWEEAPDVSDRQ